MKKLFLIWCFLVGISGKGGGDLFAQNDPIAELNSQLRIMMGQLVNPTPDVRFLYDLSVHQVDSIYFSNFTLDTSNTNNWYMVYKEMYHAAYDTMPLATPTDIALSAIQYTQRDTIPIGLIEVGYNRLKDEAMNTGDYFVFDTVNDVWYDKFPRPSSPYVIDTLFIGSTLYPSSHFANVTFVIDPQFFIIDNNKNYGSPDDKVLKIDFDDGNGWQVISNLTAINTYNVLYPSAGTKIIKFGTFSGINWGTSADSLLQFSQSVFTVLHTRERILPDKIITKIDGIEVNVFDNSCATNTDAKYVIYLEGFDFLENRNASQIYDDMIKEEQIAQLKNFGYKFLVVNWTNSHRNIEANAMSIVAMIDALKCGTLLMDSTKPLPVVPPPFVLIGESMSGIIGRYVLTYMESPEYRGRSSCMPDYMHNTRLFISLDAPQQGANIPLSIQHLYNNFAMLSPWFSPFDNVRSLLYKDFLFSDAAKQMLLYHVSTDNQFGLPAGNSSYTSHYMKKYLDEKIEAMGNYPKYCKLMSISNGALNGTGQTRSWDNEIRTPNDILMSVANETYIRVLGIKILGTYSDIALHTNPDGNGKLIGLSMGVSHWKIKLKWFGVKLVFGNTELLNVSKFGKDIRPYCTSAGSTVTSSGFNGNITPFEMPNWVQMFIGLNVTYSSLGQGKIKIGSTVGLPFFANMNADLILRTDGFGFGFIPTQSSLDFLADQPKDLSFDIKNQTTTYIMDRTPFDVLITRPFNNFGHLSMDNTPYSAYQTCSNDSIRSTPISREIGDDSLFVESIEFGFTQLWEAETNVQVGVRNPYYNYPNADATTSEPGYNKNSPLNEQRHLYLARHTPVITHNRATFRANGNVSLSGDPFDVVGGYQVQQGLMQLCCVNYRAKAGNGNRRLEANNTSMGFLNLAPNPVNESLFLTLHYRFAHTSGKAWVTLYTANGTQMTTIALPYADQTIESYYQVSLKELILTPGMYFVRISNGTESYSSKLIITP